MDMMQLYERSFNPQLCKQIADKAEEHLLKDNQVCVNGAWYDVKGDHINAAQIIQLTRRDWCNSSLKVYVRDDVTDKTTPARELKMGVCVKLTPRMAFTIRQDTSDPGFSDTDEQREARRLSRLRHPVEDDFVTTDGFVIPRL